MKRILCMITAIITLFSVCCIQAFADDSDLFMIGDFSEQEITFVSGIGHGSKWTCYSNVYLPSQTDEVTMLGKNLSLKWDRHTDGTVQSNGLYTPINTRISSPQMNDIGTALTYNKIGAWIYSDVANGQQMNVLFYDAATGRYTQETDVTVDWTGWKLVNVDFNRSLGDYSKPELAATASDKFYVNLQTSGWTKNPLPDTSLYVDSIFLYRDGYFDPAISGDGALKISPSIADGSSDVSTQTKQLVFESNREFKLEKDYYSSFITVSKNGIPLSEGLDYSVQQQYKRLYVAFNDTFADKDEIAVGISEGAEMNDGSAIPATAVTFETGIAELEFDGYEFSLVGESGETAITQPPASGTVRVSARVKNITDSTVFPTIFVGVYDKTTNEMKKIESGSVSGGIGANETETIFAEVSADSYSNCYIRAFIWDSETGMYSYGASGEI